VVPWVPEYLYRGNNLINIQLKPSTYLTKPDRGVSGGPFQSAVPTVFDRNIILEPPISLLNYLSPGNVDV
jgi:hypothetical protein